jgi:methyl-accepting chemotaxis protein WspA
MRIHLNGLKIRQKLLISSLVYALPITVLLYFVISGINRNIDFTRLEGSGARMLRPMEDLLDLVIQHKLLAHLYLSGDKKLKDAMDETTGKIDQAFAALDATALELAEPLMMDAESMEQAGMRELLPARVRNRWSELRDRLGSLPVQESDSRHEKIISDMRSLTALTGDNSKLVLDPDLDSYYLMDLVLLAMPPARTRLGEIALFARQALARGLSETGNEPVSSMKEMARFTVFSTLLEETDLPRILRSGASALREDKDFYEVSSSLQEKLPPLLESYEREAQPLIKTLRTLGEKGAAHVPADELVSRCTRTWEAASELRKAALDELQSLLDKRTQSFKTRRLTVLLATLGALFIAVSLALYISRGITGPLTRVMRVARQIASGEIEAAKRSIDETASAAHGEDLQGDLESGSVRDEIWQLSGVFARMTRSLHSLIGEVRSSGIQVVSSATEISASARQLEATAAQQAASISQVSTTSREISANSRELVLTMGEVSAVASETAALAEEGHSGLQGMESTMRNLVEATASIASKLETISDKAGNIGSIVTTITKVADQTNLLSLNAGIEAEKAGEYGLGFSVVAREIRRLADQTAMATLDIEQMVKEMQSAVSSGVMEVDKFVQQVRQGGQDVGRIGTDLATVIRQVQTLIPRFESVNRSMEAQSSGAEEISSAMSHVSEGADQAKQVVSEFNKAVSQLTEAVDRLQGEVAKFKVA